MCSWIGSSTEALSILGEICKGKAPRVGRFSVSWIGGVAVRCLVGRWGAVRCLVGRWGPTHLLRPRCPARALVRLARFVGFRTSWGLKHPEPRLGPGFWRWLLGRRTAALPRQNSGNQVRLRLATDDLADDRLPVVEH